MTSASQGPPTFPAGVELVRIDVVVLDHDGRPVTGLTAADFEISESGRLHEIASFEPIVVRPAPAPASVEPPAPPPVSESIASAPAESRYFLIFFDDVHVSAPAAERVRAQLIPFLERETRAGDWVTIASTLAGRKWTARTTFERQQLPAVVRGLKGQLVRKLRKDDPSEFDAMRTSEYGGRAAMEPRGPNSQFTGNSHLLAEEVYAVAKRRVRQSLTGLSEAILSMSGFRGRKSLIFYSEGFIRSPAMADYDRAIEIAQRARVAVYFVDPRGLASGLPMADGQRELPNPLIQLDTEAGGTSYVATATGGRTSISNDATALLHDAMVESSAYYLLGFHPSTGEPGERKLKVRVRREGVTVRAPDRYVAGEPAPSSKPVPPAVQALGLVSDATDIPLRVSTLFLDASLKGEVTTTVAVEIEKGAAVNGHRRLNLLIEARPLDHTVPVRDTAEMSVPSGGGAAVATRELHLRPGVWQARIVVRDAQTEKLGSVLHTFEVPNGVGLRVSSPILTDEMEGSRVPRPRLRLDRHYRSGGALYCQYRVFGAAVEATSGKPRVRASYAIVRNGQVIQAGPSSTIEPTSDGRLLRLLGFGLAGFEPGDYTLVLHVVDDVSGQSREVREPFTIVPAQG
jgi:VWFA-related protein